METENPAPAGILSRPQKFVERHAAEGWTEGGLRWLLFKSRENGLDQAGAVIRHGRKVFIDETRFFSWLREQGTK